MLRLPNPGSDIRSFIRIFQVLYEELEQSPTFTLDDMSWVLVQRNLASSSGYIGGKALELSNSRKTNQLKPLYNQSKMYSELFRVLGWIHPEPNNQLLGHFTYLGMHAATAVDPAAVFQEGVLGIAYPNPHVEAKGDYMLRPFACILRTMAALGNQLCRDEMILGPLSLPNDRDLPTFRSMIDRINNLRGDWRRLDAVLKEAAKKRAIAVNTMHNYTRFPIGVLEWCSWATKERIKSVYKKPAVFQVLTPAGREQARWIEQAADVRASDLRNLPDAIRQAAVRTSFYEMLRRAGFDIAPVQEIVMADLEVLAKNPRTPAPLREGKEILFSPFQELSSATLDPCFPNARRVRGRTASFASPPPVRRANMPPEAIPAKEQCLVTLAQVATVLNRPHESVSKDLHDLYDRHGGKTAAVVDALVKRYETANRDTFYPLVAQLFRIVGYNCEHTRGGVNYQRWDALILDDSESVPIEIKSPGEEVFLSVKAVRQALENKIILLARKQVPTQKETTSLAVGYKPPNDRSEVTSLIQDINKTFGVRIGIIDFRSLLRLAIAVECEGRVPNPRDLVELNGIIELTYA